MIISGKLLHRKSLRLTALDNNILDNLEKFSSSKGLSMANKRTGRDRRTANGRRSDSDRRTKQGQNEVDQRSDRNRRLDNDQRAGIERRGLGDIFTEES